MFSRRPRSAKPAAVRSRSNHASCCNTARLEPLEERLLLAVDFTAQTNVFTTVFGGTELPRTTNPGVVNGFNDITDSVGGAYAHAWTDGSDPGWHTPGTSDDLAARARATASSDGNIPAVAEASAVLDYMISLTSVKDWPNMGDLAPLTRFVVPIKMTFRHYVKVEGAPTGASTAVGSSRIEAFSSNLPVPWVDIVEQTTAGEQETNPVVYEVIPWSPQNEKSGHVGVMLSSAAAVSMVTQGTISVTVVSDPAVEFDQAAFNQYAAGQGFAPFNLSEYFSLTFGFDSRNGLPAAPAATASEPDLEDASDTGASNSDDITGDMSPTFTGVAVALPGEKPPTQVILYADGVEVGRGPVVNGTYRITSAILPPGAYDFTAAAGTSDAKMGGQSTPLAVTLDEFLPGSKIKLAIIGEGGSKAVTFTDDDGTTATVRLTAGTATVTFHGATNLTSVQTPAGEIISGVGPQIASIVISGDTGNASLLFTLRNGKGSNGQVEVGDITSAGGIKSINGKGVNLWGDMDIGGPVGSLTLGDIRGTQSTIELGGTPADKPAVIVLDDVRDLTLLSGSPIGSLSVARWWDSAADDLITAPAIGKLSSGGLFGAGLDLSGQGVVPLKPALGTTNIKGRLTGGTWTIHGSTAAINVIGIGAAWSAAIDGAVQSLTSKAAMSGVFDALSVGAMSVTGDLDAATITLSQGAVGGQPKTKALGSLKVTGAMNGSSLDSAGHIGKVTLARMIDSTIFAGVDTGRAAIGTLPDDALDFAAAAAIDSLKVVGVRGAVSFADSFVAAANLGTISLAGLPADGTASGGIAGDQLLTKYTRKAGAAAAVTVKGPQTAPQTADTLDAFIFRIV